MCYLICDVINSVLQALLWEKLTVYDKS